MDTRLRVEQALTANADRAGVKRSREKAGSRETKNNGKEQNTEGGGAKPCGQPERKTNEKRKEMK
jgi:hypothetical protein